MKRVAAVVVTYNRKALLQQCLDALQEQTHPLAEIIVVDNASTDGTRAMVREAYPEVDLLALEENRGGAGGFHAGMRRAMEREVDWIWVMDDDAEPVSDALEQLFAPGLHHNEDTVALTSLKMFPDGRPQYDQTGWYQPLKMEIVAVKPAKDSITEIKYGSFVGLLVRKQVVRQVGLPDPGFFIWYDDVEYCMRLAQVGRLYLVRSSRITHHVADSGPPPKPGEKPWRNRPLSYYWRFYYRYRNPMLALHKHESDLLQRCRGYGSALYQVLRRILSTMLYDENNKWRRVWVVGLGFLHGIRGRDGKVIDPARFAE